MNYKKTLSLYLPTERKIKNLVMRKLLLYGYVTHYKDTKKVRISQHGLAQK